MASGLIDPVLPRFECKYLIDPILVPEMRAFIRAFAEPDPYAALRADEGYRYTICSLYLDSQDLRLYQQTVCGEKRRFKLRIRSYGDEPSEPVFLEIKRRENVILQKTRARVPRECARALLDGKSPESVPGLPERCRDAVGSFCFHTGMILAEPVIRVRYLREAWVAATGEPVRVTFDTNLMHAVTFDGNLSCSAGDWHATPTDGVILEIKFTERFPFWIHDLVSMFGLNQRSVPKYVMSVDQVLTGGRGSTLSTAGFTLAPNSFGAHMGYGSGRQRRARREEN